MKALNSLKAVSWQARKIPLKSLLLEYEKRHNACINSEEGLPRKYILVRLEDDVGIGNNLPNVITGVINSGFYFNIA